jgi:hypothetical protein
MTSGTASLIGYHPGRLALEQLCGYTVRNPKTFGILTTLRGWRFAFPGNQGQFFMTSMFAANPSQPIAALPGSRQPNVAPMLSMFSRSFVIVREP